ncbi:MAG: hypothetical protein Q9182_004243 [Xanthomendoza sp. 2 TL-2023]
MPSGLLVLLSIFSWIDLASNLYEQARYEEVEILLSPLIDYLEQTRDGLEIVVLDVRWLIALVWLNQTKVEESRQQALMVVKLTVKVFGAQHRRYIARRVQLRRLWGINPDETVFEVPDNADENAQPEQVVDIGETDTAAEREQVRPV